MKANKERIINEILLKLEGGATYTATKVTFTGGDLRLSGRTFDRYWTDAQQRYQRHQQEQQQELRKVSDAAAKERLEKAILTKDETLTILSSIVKGEKGKEDKYRPSFGERIQAAKTVADLQGWNSPQKINVNEGAPLVVRVIAPPTEDEDGDDD